MIMQAKIYPIRQIPVFTLGNKEEEEEEEEELAWLQRRGKQEKPRPHWFYLR